MRILKYLLTVVKPKFLFFFAYKGLNLLFFFFLLIFERMKLEFSFGDLERLEFELRTFGHPIHKITEPQEGSTLPVCAI